MVRSRDLATVGVGPSGANDAEERCWSRFVHRIAENRIVPEGLQIGDDDEWGHALSAFHLAVSHPPAVRLPHAGPLRGA